MNPSSCLKWLGLSDKFDECESPVRYCNQSGPKAVRNGSDRNCLAGQSFRGRANVCECCRPCQKLFVGTSFSHNNYPAVCLRPKFIPSGGHDLRLTWSSVCIVCASLPFQTPASNVMLREISSFSWLCARFVCAVTLLRDHAFDMVETVGPSMAPTLNYSGDQVLVVRMGLRAPVRGDIVLVRSPVAPSKMLCKRVAGLVRHGFSSEFFVCCTLVCGSWNCAWFPPVFFTVLIRVIMCRSLAM